MKKITDKMRLDWLLANWCCTWVHMAPLQHRRDMMELKTDYLNTRKAIDSAIRVERKEKL